MEKSKRKLGGIRSAVIGCAFVMAISLTTVLGVRAYLMAGTKDKQNYFAPLTYTNIDISEPNGNNFTIGNVNKSAVITNPKAHSVKPVYIRAAIVVVVRGEGNINLSERYNYTIANFTPGNNWTYNGSDGYYYYTIPVDPGESTTDLFGRTNIVFKDGENTVDSLPDDVKNIDVQVISDAVQAVEVDGEPITELGQKWSDWYTTTPATNAWGGNIPKLKTQKS